MDAMIIGYNPKLKNQLKKQAEPVNDGEVQELKAKLSKSLGKLGYQKKLNNQLERELKKWKKQ